MAQKVKIILEDDLTGGSADETVRFSLDGKHYEMDLSVENATQLRETVRPFTDKARRIPATKRHRSRRSTPAPRNGETAKIRAWAQDKGYEVSERGRVHQHIKDAYYATQKTTSQ